MNNDATELNCKAKITENKNGKLIITLYLDSYDQQTAVLQEGTVPKGVINKVIIAPVEPLTENEQASQELTKILKTEGVGEFQVGEKIFFVEVYNEPKKE